MSHKSIRILIRILIALIVIGIIIFFTTPSVSKQVDDTRENIYKTYERMMLEATKNFIAKCIGTGKCEGNHSLVEYESIYVLRYETLKELGYIKDLIDSKSDIYCTGYVDITSSNVYKTVLICGKKDKYNYISEEMMQDKLKKIISIKQANYYLENKDKDIKKSEIEEHK